MRIPVQNASDKSHPLEPERSPPCLQSNTKKQQHCAMRVWRPMRQSDLMASAFA